MRYSGISGDMVVKKFLNDCMQEVLGPIRERRKYYEERLDEVFKMLEQGKEKATEVTNVTLNEVRDAIGINYFTDDSFKENYV